MKRLIVLLALLAGTLLGQPGTPAYVRSGPNLPATCQPGALSPSWFLKTGAGPVATPYYCSAINTWTPAGGGGGGGTPGGSTNDIQVNNAGSFAGGRGTLDSSGNLTIVGNFSGYGATFYNATASTGATRVNVIGGAGQGNNGSYILQWWTNSVNYLAGNSAPLLAVQADGSFGVYQGASPFNRKQYLLGITHALSSDGVVCWNNNVSVDASACDTTFSRTAAGIVGVNGGIATGASPPPLTGTGITGLGESTGQTCASGADCLEANSSSHQLLLSNNNATAVPVAVTPATTTANNIPVYTGNIGSTFGAGITPGSGVAAALAQAVSGSGAICLASGSACSGSGSGGTVVPKSAGYTFVSGDSGNIFPFSGSSLTATLPSSPPTMPWLVGIKNLNASALTIARNGNTINGGTANITLQQYQSVVCASDTVTGGNYVCDVPAVAGSNITLTPAPNGMSFAAAGGANTALSNLSAVSINTSLLAQTGADLGSTTNPFRNMFLFGAGTYGTNYFEFTGTPTSTRVLTVPDATDTFAVLAATQTLTNKTLDGVTPTVMGYLDATSSIQTQLNALAPKASPTLTGTPAIAAATGTSLSVTGALTSGSGGGVSGQLNLSGSSSGTVTVTVAAASGTWTETKPTTAGTSGYFLQTDGSGVETWAAGPSISCATTGGILIGSTGACSSSLTFIAGNSPSFVVATSFASDFATVAQFLAGSNTVAGHHTNFTFGVGAATGNAAGFEFVYQGSNNSLNAFQIDSFGRSNFFQCTVLGKCAIGYGDTSTASTLDITDTTASTGATRVVVGLGAADSASTVTLTNAGTTKSQGYQSSDGTAGASQTCTILSITAFVVKNGLVVSCS